VKLARPLIAVLPASHRLAVQKALRVQDLAEEIYITPTRWRRLKAVIESYATKSGVVLKPHYDAENLSSVLSLFPSSLTNSVATLSASAAAFLRRTLSR
jgi:hypothetical protein